MNRKTNLLCLLIILTMSMLAACQNQEAAPEPTESATSSPEALPTPTTAIVEPTPSPEDTVPADTPEPSPTAEAQTSSFQLPNRPGTPIETTGTVPHIQTNVEPIPEINEELIRLAFSLPGVEERPTVVSLPGALGMWLAEEVQLLHPEAIVSGREFAHIHPDGSLHAPLPFERALEMAEKGWGERHPWADERAGWDGFVMIFTPLSDEELEIVFQLIVESYNHVTGLELDASDY